MARNSNNCLKNNFKLDIMILIIQPRGVSFGYAEQIREPVI